ncbi:hypothetical protein A2U01_0049712, partial [Trifolium medium]|nr:hypothetical protein [Trifolium medium]
MRKMRKIYQGRYLYSCGSGSCRSTAVHRTIYITAADSHQT